MKKAPFANKTHPDAGRATASIALLAALAVCLAAAGCGSKLASVTGTVTLDGKPLSHGTIVFHGAGSATGYGEIRSDGSYTIRTGDQRGLKPGTYRVTITAYQTGAGATSGEAVPDLLTPKRYNGPDTSGLTAEVKPGQAHFDFNLKR